MNKIGNKVFLLKKVLLKENDLDREGPYAAVDTRANRTVEIRPSAIAQPINAHRLVSYF